MYDCKSSFCNSSSFLAEETAADVSKRVASEDFFDGGSELGDDSGIGWEDSVDKLSVSPGVESECVDTTIFYVSRGYISLKIF